MANVLVNKQDIQDIADEIRIKTGKSTKLKVNNMAEEISKIGSGGGDDPYTFPDFNYSRNLQIVKSIKKDDYIRCRLLDSTINPDIDNFELDFSPIQQRYGRYFDYVTDDNIISGRIGYGGIDGNTFLPGLIFGKKTGSSWVTSIGGSMVYYNEKFAEIKDDLSLPYEIEYAGYGYLIPRQSEWRI